MEDMTAEQAAEWGKTLDFPTVWAALMESKARIDKLGENISRMGAKVDKTTENINRMAEKIDRIGDNVGGLNRSVGELVETLVAARLWEKFPQYDLKRAYQRLPIYDEKNVKKSDIDILLVNTVMCMATEVKRELDRMKDVDDHLKRMQLIRKYPPEQVGGKELLGAMAGGVVDPDVKNYAYECGFYVLELTGESVRLIPPPEGFEPKKW
jgi:outer membrane murein-binding lipoprotein Lpp